MKLYKSLTSIAIFLMLLMIPKNIHATTNDVIKGCKNSPVGISMTGSSENDTFTFKCGDSCNFRSEYSGHSLLQIGGFVRYSKNYRLVFPVSGEHNVSAFKDGVLCSTAKIVIADNHSYGNMEVEEAATCTSNGTGKYTCTICKNSYTEQIPATGHKYTEEITQKQTCTEDEIKIYTCSNCGDRNTKRIPATGHKYTETLTQKQTCTENGVKTYTCSNCGSSHTESVLATGHNYVKTKSSKPTCTKDGIENYICSECGAYSEKILSSTGHSYSGWTIIKKATIFNKGEKSHVCLNCNSKEVKMIKKLPSEISLSKSNLHIKVGKQQKLKIKKKTKGDKILYWKSSRDNIVSINKKTGKIKALKSGSSKVTLKMRSGCTATCIIFVYEKRNKRLEKNPNLPFIVPYR